MSNKIYFTPGPTQMYPGMDQFLQDAMSEDVASISHRSNAFRDIYKATADRLSDLIDLPKGYHILFLGSASEAWERISLNCVEDKSFHFVNGSFSKKFHQYALGLGKNAIKEEVPFGEGFERDKIAIPEDNELIAVTQNETSSGVQFPVEDIHYLRETYPDQLIAVDMVSSLPIPALDFSKIDTAFFSVQKCFGMPAGLGVWIVNDRCLEKAKSMKKDGFRIGPHHNLPELVKKAADYQTPSTPNVLSIYLLGRICERMLADGIQEVRKQADQKAEILYKLIEDCGYLDYAVKKPSHRSKTVVVANTKKTAAQLNDKLSAQGFIVGSGYGNYKESQIRIATFPSHSVEDIKNLAAQLLILDDNIA